LVAVVFDAAAGVWFEEHLHMHISDSSAEIASLRLLLALQPPGLAIM
jgi:hypothetical protein